MLTSLGHRGKLTQKQLTRLGGLIAFFGGRRPYDPILEDLLGNGFLVECGDWFEITEKGLMEVNRITAMAGLRPEQFTDGRYLELFKRDGE